ncbi:ABC transporter ATP-binding protein [Spirochaetota bacterium]
MIALTIRNLKKTYFNDVEALKGVSLEVKEGDFYALLGPNGAGKTTIIGILTSLVIKNSGKIQVFGYDIDNDINKIKSLIGVVPQEINFNVFETVFQIVVNQAGYYGIPPGIAKKRAEFYLKKLGIWEKRDSRARQLSGGMKRRLMIARALIHEPKLLILDEPTAGVDIELRRSMWDFITDLNKKGTTIILTTHYLEEAETLCRHVAIIDKGIIVKDTSLNDLLKMLDHQTIVLNLKNKITSPLIVPSYDIKQIDDHIIEVHVNREQNINNFFSHLNKMEIEILSMRNKKNRLEELFVKHVEKSI